MSLERMATSLAKFSYPPLRHAYIVYRRRARVAHRQRRLRLFVGLFCLIGFAALLTGSVWLLIKAYSTKIVNMERNFSHVYTANSLFVNKIIVTNRLQNEGPIVYGFSTAPKLDKQINWTVVHDAVVQIEEHQEWSFWLNKGSQVDFRYNILDPSLTLLLLVFQGEKSLHKWEQDQSSTDLAALSMIVQGAGVLEYDVETDDRYFFGVQNIQYENVKVNVTLNLQSKVHSRENFRSQCQLVSSKCAVHLDYFGSNMLLLTTPQISERIEHGRAVFNGKSLQEDDFWWSVDVAFEQQWVTYLVFWGAMAIVMLILFALCKPSFSDMDAPQDATDPVMETATSPLVSQVDSEKVAKAEQSEACSIILSDDAVEGIEDSESFLCIICFDQQRNCFFDPCGHCATCYACSMKIVKKKKAVCPLCRQPIRFVRKIFVC